MKTERAIIKLIQRGSKKRPGSSFFFFFEEKNTRQVPDFSRKPRIDYVPSFSADDLNAVEMSV